MKRVRVAVTIEYETEVPADWDDSNVEFWLNDSSHCVQTELDVIREYVSRDDGCLCSHATFAVVKEGV
jgi:hypothetical protein